MFKVEGWYYCCCLLTSTVYFLFLSVSISLYPLLGIDDGCHAPHDVHDMTTRRPRTLEEEMGGEMGQGEGVVDGGVDGESAGGAVEVSSYL